MGEDRGSVSELNHFANLRRSLPCRLDRLTRHGTSASEVGPGPGVISVGHCFEPNGTAGGRNGFMPRFSVSAMMAARASAAHQLIVDKRQFIRTSTRTGGPIRPIATLVATSDKFRDGDSLRHENRN